MTFKTYMTLVLLFWGIYFSILATTDFIKNVIVYRKMVDKDFIANKTVFLEWWKGILVAAAWTGFWALNNL